MLSSASNSITTAAAARELSPVDERPRVSSSPSLHSSTNTYGPLPRSDPMFSLSGVAFNGKGDGGVSRSSGAVNIPGASSSSGRFVCPRVSMPSIASPTSTRPRTRTVIKSSSASGLSLIIPTGECCQVPP